MWKKLAPALLISLLGFIVSCSSDLKTANSSVESLFGLDSFKAAPPAIVPPSVLQIDPPADSNNFGTINSSISGNNFQTGASVRLVKSGQSDINGTAVTVGSSSYITCSFDLTGAATGSWDVVVTNPDTGEATLAGGFRVYHMLDGADGLLSWWELNNDAVDAMGINNGTISGSISNASDRFLDSFGSVYYGAMTNYIRAGTTGLPLGNADRTMTGWIKITNHHLMNSFLFGYGDYMMPIQNYRLGVDGLTKNLYFTQGTETVLGNTVLKTGVWYHVAVTNSGNNVTLYLNGMIDGEGTVTMNTTTGGNDMFMFKDDMASSYLEGILDDIRIYDKTLTQDEIRGIISEKGYLIPPEITVTKGVSPVVVSWTPQPDALTYEIWRSTSLAGPYTLFTIEPGSSTSCSDGSATPGTIYYYKVRVYNHLMGTDYSKPEIGFAGAYSAFTETFESGTYDPWWTEVVAVGAPYAINSIGKHSGSYGLYAGPSACSSGCYYANEVRFTKTFATPISYFTLSMWFCSQTSSSGKVRVYVNNTDPSDTTGLIRFFNPLQPAPGWIQRSLYYFGEPGSINSITIVFYDITDSNWYYADDIVINYK